MSKRNRIQFITITAMLLALQVILGNLLQIPFLDKQYNFGFQPILIAGALLGAPAAMLVGGLGDLLGAHLFPQGAYFPGFTLTNVLLGLICALVLYRRKPTLVRVAVAVVICMLINWLLNSLWLSILYSSRGYPAWLALRGPSYLLETPANILLGYLLLKGLDKTKINLK